MSRQRNDTTTSGGSVGEDQAARERRWSRITNAECGIVGQLGALEFENGTRLGNNHDAVVAGEMSIALARAANDIIDNDGWIHVLAEHFEWVSAVACARPDGFVYALCSGSYYKIGRTKQLSQRVKTLQIQLPFPVEVAWAAPCIDNVASERFLHAALSEYRANGEWFELSPDKAKWLKSIQILAMDPHPLVPDPDNPLLPDLPVAIECRPHWQQARAVVREVCGREVSR